MAAVGAISLKGALERRQHFFNTLGQDGPEGTTVPDWSSRGCKSQITYAFVLAYATLCFLVHPRMQIILLRIVPRKKMSETAEASGKCVSIGPRVWVLCPKNKTGGSYWGGVT